jgi:hypothetical protein
MNNYLGKLDCLRESIGSKDETQDQRDKRIAANWNSDCSFESGDEGKKIINRKLFTFSIYLNFFFLMHLKSRKSLEKSFN